MRVWSRRCLHEQLQHIADVKRCNEEKNVNMKTCKPVCVTVFDYRPTNKTVIYSIRGALLALDMASLLHSCAWQDNKPSLFWVCSAAEAAVISVSASHCCVVCLCVLSFTFLTHGSARRHILMSDKPEWIQNVKMLISCIKRRSCPTLCQQHHCPINWHPAGDGHVFNSVTAECFWGWVGTSLMSLCDFIGNLSNL